MLQNSDTSSRCTTTSILNPFAFLNRSKVTYTNTNILHSTVKWFYFIFFFIHVFYTEPVEVANENEKKERLKTPKEVQDLFEQCFYCIEKS